MDQSIRQILISLIPVTAGGLLATIGGLAGAVVGHRLTLGRDSKAKTNERLELLVTTAYEFATWHETSARLTLFRFQQQDAYENSPEAKLRMLTNLYFPDLRPQLIKVLKSGLECQKWVSEAWVVQQEDLSAWLANPDRMKLYFPLAQQLIDSVSNLTESARQLLEK